MPHPIKRRSSLPPTTKSPSSSSSLATTKYSSSLLEQALSHATSSFQTTVLSVLHTAAVTCLKRILSQRLHEHFRSLPPEVVGNTSISIVDVIDNDDTNLLVVTLEDVEICQRLAIKVGLKWSETLQKQGYVELSNIALNVVTSRRGGCFLERIEQQQQPQRGMERQYDNLDKQRSNREGNEQQRQNVHLAMRNDGIALGKYTTPHATLRSLRRYLLDCDDSTGLPYTLLVDYDDATNENEISSSSSSSSSADLAVREAIRKIDAFASSNLSYWDYGYDGIIEAVRRNRDRIDYSRVLHANNNTLSSSATTYDEEEEEEEGTIQGKKKRKRGRRSTVVRFKDDDDNSNEDVARQGVKTNSGPLLKRRRRKMMQKQTEDVPAEEDGTDEVERCNGLLQPVTGRPPSFIGDETYKWEEILNEMSLEERRQLIISSIHPPYPFEFDMKKKSMGHNSNDDDDEEEAHLDAIICGALKDIGKIHLWEQTRHYPPASGEEGEEEGDDDDEDDEPPAEEAIGNRNTVVVATMFGTSMTRASLKSQNRNRRQKRAMVRATKERLGRRIVSINEHKAAYAKAVSCSKIRWTEDDDDTHINARQGPRKWLEMDLGECTIELIDDKGLLEPNDKARESDNDQKVKRILSFRSLEVALMH